MRKASCLAAILIVAASPIAALAQQPDPRPAVTVTGDGMVSIAPDRAIVTSGVVTRAPTASAALKANAAAMTKVMAALKDVGIADRDVGTSGLSVQAQYDYGEGSAPRTPKLTGYEVRNTVSIRARDVDKVGDLVDAVVAAGSNQIEGLVFDVSDRTAKLDDARKQAIADARRKAELYAAGAGATLGAPLSIDEQDAAGEGPRPQMFALRAKSADAAAPTPVARGEQEINVRVTVRWELK